MSEFDYWNEVSTIGDLLVRGANLHPGRDALILPHRRATYGELLEGAIRVTRGLLAIGIQPGDHVGMFTSNSVEFAEGLFGIALLGGVAVPLNARHKAAELGYIIQNAELKALFTTADEDEYTDFTSVLHDALPSLAEARDPHRLVLEEAPSLKCAILLRGAGRKGFLSSTDFYKLAEQVGHGDVDRIRRRVRLRDKAAILYTSGTTANPKGCLLSHEAMTRGSTERARTRFSTGERDVHWGAGPLFHIGSLAPFIGAIGAGATYLTDTFYEPERALRLMETEGVTTAWPWFSAIVQALLDHPTFDASKLDTLRSVLVIAPRTLVERVQSTFPKAEIIQGCGMTETAGIFAISGPDESQESRATTQGKASPGIDIRIVDPESGTDTAPGQAGEILVRGYCVMDGYFRDPEKTAAALDANGWLHTGDLYRRDTDGRLLFNGRLKDMLKVGGENVAAIEIEAFLCSHPEVKLAEVVGRPDERLDEAPVAFVELRPGSTLTADGLIDFCKGRIARYKIPQAIYFMAPEEWPMSATKVNKPALRKRVMDNMK